MFVENWTGDNTTASILFCMRIDYNLNGESINFHETIVDVTIDLTSNFTLDAVNVVRTSATDAQQDVDVDYPVTAYFCDGTNAAIADPTLAQGDAMQFCVKKDVRNHHKSSCHSMILACFSFGPRSHYQPSKFTGIGQSGCVRPRHSHRGRDTAQRTRNSHHGCGYLRSQCADHQRLHFASGWPM